MLAACFWLLACLALPCPVLPIPSAPIPSHPIPSRAHTLLVQNAKGERKEGRLVGSVALLLPAAVGHAVVSHGARRIFLHVSFDRSLSLCYADSELGWDGLHGLSIAG
ncbi:uncharacterized protein K452DRAFT_57161 [Aplosporella prunicola CBS 121167]|uniref:Secreted protein n=1 Tax=Aplosporella prunicola CBS 121167 TaxID=1176127 RepID=A0A6A6B7J3_9PEZI|nr:uncharacterized protein K452DRAFT_57161 [Aplosporella prunicola CBS 121167]KAF2139876.1 hypothetical protein K452DRAFT_57161 [Aplosporella prunicola CBS 121167]